MRALIAIALMGGAVALLSSGSSSPPSKGYSLSGCIVLVTDFDIAAETTRALGAAMPALMEQFPNWTAWEPWAAALNQKLWGNCDVWTVNLAANGMQTFRLYLAALQAAVDAKKLAPAFALAELEGIREKAKALGIDPAGWGELAW